MNRRTVLLGLGATVAAGSASAGIFDTIKTAVVGHVNDLSTRYDADEFVKGIITAGGIFDETAEGRDPIHWANGMVSIVVSGGKKYIQLEADFEAGPLPDGWVTYSETKADVDTWNEYRRSNSVEVAPLKKSKGATYYEIPFTANPKSVTIICKQFSQYIGSAEILDI